MNGDIINPIQSVRLHSAPAFSFLYGTVEVRMKLARGDWLWPCTNSIHFFMCRFHYCLIFPFFLIAVFLMPTDLEYGK